MQVNDFKRLLKQEFSLNSSFWCPIALANIILDFVDDDFIPIWIT